ncbi:Coq4 family protein [Microbulbifer sp. YPW1]|uniref:Coq4 family protein n=1 Tax=Microbulbifer sp. YPW1 TaxID=2745199 RepID=UPI00159B3B22|nr:Coq4 family protein [Microbulbifer sp. YPW1]QKX17207.1 hypothetical protein HUW35_09460 [Microbulbifer sp. YPW1]
MIRLDRRYYLRGLYAAFRWMMNPVSEGGAKQVPRARIYLTGPQILKDVEEMRRHPVGARLLREKPDFGEACQLKNLENMPEGSFGHAYYKMMSAPGIAPAYLLAGLAYRDGFFDSIDMDEDTRWLLERGLFEHDPSHILSGYGTDLSGEMLNILYAQGLSGVPRWLAFAGPFGILSSIIIPKVGWKEWRRLLKEAYRRGAQARAHFPPQAYPYEELFPRPLSEVREYLGIEPLPEGFSTAGWLNGSFLGRKFATGFAPKKNKAKNKSQKEAESKPDISALSQLVIDRGVHWRDFMRAGKECQERLRELAASGASSERLQAELSN